MSCILAFKGGCSKGPVTEGGHCQHHLAWARKRALLHSPTYEQRDKWNADDDLLSSNGTGSRYQKPEHIWETEKGALRRPSRAVMDTPQFERGFVALNPAEADFMEHGGWVVWEVPTGETPGRPKSGITDEDELIVAINEGLAPDWPPEMTRDEARAYMLDLLASQTRLARIYELTKPGGRLNRNSLSTLRKEQLAGVPRHKINTETVKNLYGLADRRSARNLVRSSNPAKGGNTVMSQQERLINIESQLDRIYAAVDETLQLVRGCFPDDAHVAAAVEEFIAVALRDERAA